MSGNRAVRPKTQLAPATRLDTAFEDPGGVLDLIRRCAPYKTQEAAHKHPGVTRTGGWFRNFWALGGKVLIPGAEKFFDNPNFIAAARKSFAAEVVRPVALMTNLNLPMAGLPPHLDLPFFRGAMNREVPAWMLVPMGYSGLFHDWAVPVASAITWFYDGPGGDFEYWPEGLSSPSRTERPPYFNCAVLADNEYMYHRVGATGRPEDFVTEDAIPYDAELALVDKTTWAVRHQGETLLSYEWDAVRLSLLWKAYCFRSHDEAAAFDDHSDELTPSLVTDLFCEDLRARGIAFERPDDPIADLAWKAVLERAYPAPGIDQEGAAA